MKDLKTDTLLVHAGRHRDANWDYVNPPVVRGSTVLHQSSQDMIDRVASKADYMNAKPCYGTYASPLHKAFYEALMALEGSKAVGAWAFSTGLAACTTPLFAFLKAGDHALFVDTIYGPTRAFAEETLTRMGVDVEFFDPKIGGDIRKLFRANTTLVMMESPGSHSFELMDVPAIAEACRERGIASVIDNTWATPLYFKPLDVGVDMVIHAATKYIAGHSDLTMGVVICNERVWSQVYHTVTQFGQAASGDDIWLAYRGLHTMSVRVKHAAASAAEVIAWLQKRPEVERVCYPALPDDPSYSIWKRDYTGATSLFAVVLKPEYEGKIGRFVDALTIFGRGYSWGGYESLLIPGYGKRTVTGSPFNRMMRLAVGLEDPKDLIRDLEAGFAAMHEKDTPRG